MSRFAFPNVAPHARHTRCESRGIQLKSKGSPATESQRESLSNAFTRIAYNVTHYNLSLPPTHQVKGLLKPWFVSDLDTMDPIELYRTYGTHLLQSMTIGGHALFLYSTDTRAYEAELSIEAAARVSASYLVSSGKIELSAAQKKAMQSFNESSQTTVATRTCCIPSGKCAPVPHTLLISPRCL